MHASEGKCFIYILHPTPQLSSAVLIEGGYADDQELTRYDMKSCEYAMEESKIEARGV
jgi:hypothetical protein